MDVRKIVSEAFLMAIIEGVRKDGPEKTLEWIEHVADSLGEKEGPGLEGDPRGSLNCLYICPFANALQEFQIKYGETPSEFMDILGSADCSDTFAASNVFCIFHHTIRTKRAELAGRKVYHLASSANAERKTAYNEKAIEAVGLTKDAIDELMEKTVCVFKYE
ncbi:MAG: hypothetical protein ACXQT2_05160 [Methanotrichaceae archaeon]